MLKKLEHKTLPGFKYFYTYDSGTAKILVPRKGIIHEVFVDEADLAKLVGWSINIFPADKFESKFRARVNSAGEYYLLHRFILSPPDELGVDHIDGNPLNCTRKNLRVCTQAENLQNRLGAQRNNTTSGIRGVSWDSRRGGWRARVGNVQLGNYSTVSEAEAALKTYRAKHMPFSSDATEAENDPTS